ncbi:hypothetical protein DRJ17_03045 [Candidatus Woesearchaeota archaeon]|nr:MAG: hypothetical protein DRJ17_03045 [Candidatus Woesearchaeota archaeon]
MLTRKELKEIRKELDNCANPIFFFHDDPDGLASFLLLYRYKKDGHGVIVKSHPKIVEEFAKKVKYYNADKVFILDLALVDQEFIDAVKVPVVWIDHHGPLKRRGVKYFNPRTRNPKDNFPVSYICYLAVKGELWIAMLGTVGDWFMPKFAKTFMKRYPDLLPANIKKPEDALFKTRLGDLIRISSFVTKGKISEVMKCVKIFTRIKSPYEILNQETAQGKYIYRRYEKINKEYKILLRRILKSKKGKKILVFPYKEIKHCFTKELANELLYLFPDKVILIAREKAGEMKTSLRARDVVLPPIVKKVFTEIEGYGGGHEHACGAVVKKKDFDRFVKLIEDNI